jgi:hypothetical protein
MDDNEGVRTVRFNLLPYFTGGQVTAGIYKLHFVGKNCG